MLLQYTFDTCRHAGLFLSFAATAKDFYESKLLLSLANPSNVRDIKKQL